MLSVTTQQVKAVARRGTAFSLAALPPHALCQSLQGFECQLQAVAAQLTLVSHANSSLCHSKVLACTKKLQKYQPIASISHSVLKAYNCKTECSTISGARPTAGGPSVASRFPYAPRVRRADSPAGPCHASVQEKTVRFPRLRRRADCHAGPCHASVQDKPVRLAPNAKIWKPLSNRK